VSTAIGPSVKPEELKQFFLRLNEHSRTLGMQAAHELILSVSLDRHLKTALSLATDGNHAAVVGRYINETMANSWPRSTLRMLIGAIAQWQKGGSVKELEACFSEPLTPDNASSLPVRVLH
jgi:hypothetical protein